MKKSVCILDDDPNVAAMVARVATASGLDAREFTTAAPFLDEVRNSNPELVILDLALGRLDAIDVMRQLERLPYAGHVVLISGHAEDVLSDAERIGARRGLRMLPSLKKPFRIQQFHAILQALDQAPVESRTESPPLVPAEEPPKADFKIDFKEALGNKWLEVWYQPKVDLKSLMICGAEALVRMRHPDHGVLRPAQFLPPSDDPLHLALARAVLKHAIVDWHEFAQSGVILKMAINAPVSAVSAADFVPLVRAALPPDDRFPGLIIELTEDEAIRNPDTMREVATQLRLNKVALSIDDFGSGYGSLWRLAEVPFGELKLDGKFVHGCASDKSKRKLCRTVIELGHEFEASVCAEAVEDPADLQALTDMGCDLAQGFLFAEPMPSEAFLQLLTSPPERSNAPKAARPAPIPAIALGSGVEADMVS